MNNTEFILKLLKLIAEYDCCSDILWHTNLRFFVNCNDAFGCGGADGEEIVVEDLELLQQSLFDGGEIWGPLLFVSRKRKRKPNNRFYNTIDINLRSFFDEFEQF